jgi:hypothetical protein
MRPSKALQIGGYISGGVLIVFGIVVVVLGIWGFTFSRDHIKQEGIVFGPATDPAVAKHVALLLTGIGLVILAFAVFGRRSAAIEAAPAPAT